MQKPTYFTWLKMYLNIILLFIIEHDAEWPKKEPISFDFIYKKNVLSLDLSHTQKKKCITQWFSIILHLYNCLCFVLINRFFNFLHWSLEGSKTHANQRSKDSFIWWQVCLLINFVFFLCHSLSKLCMNQQILTYLLPPHLLRLK